MSKIKVTRKYMRNNFNVYKVGYCALQALFNTSEATAYSTRTEGWACDYYLLPLGVVISTGYAPTGKETDYQIIKQFEDKAQEINRATASIDERRQRLDDLKRELAEKLLTA